MAKIVLWTLLLSVCAVSVCNGWWGQICNPFWSAEDWKRCTPCKLFSSRQVTLIVRNVVSQPTFEESVTLDCTHSKTLFNMMTEAADANAVFRFSAKYFGSELGFFVEAINGLAGVTANQTWWEILDGSNSRTSVGVSSYIPKNGETVTFNFTQGWGH